MNVLCIYQHGDNGSLESGPQPYRDLMFANKGVDEVKNYADYLMQQYKPARINTYTIGEICKIQLPFGMTFTQETWTDENWKEYISEEDWAVCPC